MDTFDINSESSKKQGIDILDSEIGNKIKNTALLLKSKEEFSIPINLLGDYPFPYTALDIVLDVVRKETGNGYSIHRKLNFNEHVGYIIKRFR